MEEFLDEKAFWAEMARDAPSPAELSAKKKYEQLFLMRRLYTAMSSEGMTNDIWLYLEEHEEFRRDVGRLIRYLHILAKVNPQSATTMIQKLIRKVCHGTFQQEGHP